LDITRALNGHRLDGAPLYLAAGEPVATRHVEVTARTGVEYAGEWASAPLRFFDRRSAHVSQRMPNAR
jgi:DNA-3-methyladenine glycosylase